MHLDLDRQMQSWTSDLQLESPLFSKLPPELRQRVFAFALSPLEILVDNSFTFERVGESRQPHDFRIKHDHEGDPDDDIGEEPRRWVNGSSMGIWSRYPENTGPGTYQWHLCPTLLATCRRVYAESHMFLYNAERSYNCVDGIVRSRHRSPPSIKFAVDEAIPSSYAGRHKKRTSVGHWSRQRVEWERRFTSIDYHGKLSTFHRFLANTPGPMDFPWSCITTKRFPWTKVEHVRLFTSYKDRWLEEVNTMHNRFYHSWHPLLQRPDEVPAVGLERLKPAHGLELAAKRHSELKKSEAEGRVQEQHHQKPGRPGWMPMSADRYPYGSWAREFVNFPRIKTLTMNFHCPEGQRRKHEDIIQMVVDTWRFPLNPKHTGHHYLSIDHVERISWRGDKCNWINQPDGSPGAATKIERNIGPRMYTWTVVWTPKTYDGPETYPYGGLVEIGERDYQEEGDSDLDEDEEVDWEEWGEEPPLDEERGHRRKNKLSG
ncbi:uncharacterized protein PgNI_10067 [Pyricularia grisea]|uniref:DUF7730 domain-containing protein n=1 Tax=Pyricularia grisea TaxID=148305 RepID=A0A6P8ARW0_PYRGI|nr:uncharacterized protein PgNI_10067 [Pyricularia grisea]TLD04869.1 hypothetical protein PgNI_10067 [Pyricularia grisea]